MWSPSGTLLRNRTPQLSFMASKRSEKRRTSSFKRKRLGGRLASKMHEEISHAPRSNQVDDVLRNREGQTKNQGKRKIWIGREYFSKHVARKTERRMQKCDPRLEAIRDVVAQKLRKRLIALCAPNVPPVLTLERWIFDAQLHGGSRESFDPVSAVPQQCSRRKPHVFNDANHTLTKFRALTGARPRRYLARYAGSRNPR